jgi:formylglycine-generating enzyme required for sulfatase activity
MKRIAPVTTSTRRRQSFLKPSFALAAVVATSGAVFAAAASNGDAKASDTTTTVDASTVDAPGLVTLKGGRVVMGSTVKEIEALMTTSTNQGLIRVIDAERPQHNDTVPTFAIGKYEITNEQYLQYVKATSTRPPENWAGPSLKAAQAAFLKAEAEKAIAATKEGSKYDRRKWDETAKNNWWRSSWQDVEWAIPDGEEGMPVSYVDYENAIGYARWAGLRLPTEKEWVYAARGGSKQLFPWGDEWEATGHAHTSELGSQKPKKVGSFPDGMTESGLADMTGSVWEWTSSPYEAFPKFKPQGYTFKKAGRKEKIAPPEAQFNGTFRIIKGGSAQLPLLAGRIATRQGAKRAQTTNAIGFRVAGDLMPAVNKAQAIWQTEIQSSAARTQGEVFDFEGTVGLDRWTFETPERRPEGYEVIKSYEHIVFAPRADFGMSPGGELNRESRIQPVVLGFLSTTVPMVSPALPPGNYLVSYREKGRMMRTGEAEEKPEAKPEEEEGEKGGEKKEGEGEAEAEAPVDETPLEFLTPAERLLRQIDMKKTILIFSTVETGEYVASIDTKKIGPDVKATKADDGEIRLSQKSLFDENKEKITQDWMKIQANIRRSTSRVIPFEMDLQVDSSALGTGWRTAKVSPTGKKKRR